jgi:hypothetical protein
MLAFLVIVAGLYCVLHFIWESIIAPSVRLTIRFELFALRDRLRSLKIAQKELTDDAFHSVEDGIHSALHVLYDIDLPLLLHIKSAINKDDKLQERIKRRQAVVSESGCDELHEIMNKVQAIVEKTAVINTGWLILYIFPIGFVAIFCRRSFLSPIAKLLYAPKSEVGRLVPESSVELCPA